MRKPQYVLDWEARQATHAANDAAVRIIRKYRTYVLERRAREATAKDASVLAAAAAATPALWAEFLEWKGRATAGETTPAAQSESSASVAALEVAPTSQSESSPTVVVEVTLGSPSVSAAPAAMRKSRKGGSKICKVGGCTKLSRKDGVCRGHGAPSTRKTCSSVGCTNKVINNKKCQSHGANIPRCAKEGCTKHARSGKKHCKRHSNDKEVLLGGSVTAKVNPNPNLLTDDKDRIEDAQHDIPEDEVGVFSVSVRRPYPNSGLDLARSLRDRSDIIELQDQRMLFRYLITIFKEAQLMIVSPARELGMPGAQNLKVTLADCLLIEHTIITVTILDVLRSNQPLNSCNGYWMISRKNDIPSLIPLTVLHHTHDNDLSDTHDNTADDDDNTSLFSSVDANEYLKERH